MVLEEAARPSESIESFGEAQPTSDVDPYSSDGFSSRSRQSGDYLQIDQAGAEQPLYINLNDLPKPFSFLSSASRYQSLSKGINATSTYASKVLQRPITQDEADAFAFHWAKSMRTASYGLPIGVGLGVIQVLRHKDYRFPFWQPMKEGSRFSPDKLGPLRGPLARMGWQFMRLNAYCFLTATAAQIFFASYALTVNAASRAMDPRLKDFSEALKNRQVDAMKAARETAKEVREQQQGAAPAPGETYDMARQRRGVQQQREDWTARRRGRQRSQASDDDMSPTGGAFEDDFMTTGSDTGLMSDIQSKEQQDQPGSAMNTFEKSRNSPPLAAESSNQAPQPSQKPSRQQQQAQQQQSGSTWERLRQSAMSGNAANPRSTPPPNSSSNKILPASSSSNSGDSFSFSQSDEDRQLARSEAQRDFDARIEREREGKDFNDGRKGGGAGRW